MKGTEKQIAYANDLIKSFTEKDVARLPKDKSRAEKVSSAKAEWFQYGITNCELAASLIEKEDDAGRIIDILQGYKQYGWDKTHMELLPYRTWLKENNLI